MTTRNNLIFQNKPPKCSSALAWVKAALREVGKHGRSQKLRLRGLVIIHFNKNDGKVKIKNLKGTIQIKN